MLRYKLGNSFQQGMGNATVWSDDIYNIDPNGNRFINGDVPGLLVGQFFKVNGIFFKREVSKNEFGASRRVFLIPEQDHYFNVDKLISWNALQELQDNSSSVKRLFTAYIHNLLEGHSSND